ncbi:MAG: hypothetical protein KatS3mg112_1384 [Thermogutta sp.]|nr:MAG: hypothetical protein KatS3mg112_1384 [Thermogutta sp.]
MTMNSLDSKVREVLWWAAERFCQAPVPRELVNRLEQLVQELEQPCVLAVVGRAKAGKSTLVNALLGVDLAKVGVTETTATINFFRYGQPANPSRPIRCYWRSGRYEDVDRTFYESLQGNDRQTLQRAAAIERLEFFLPHEVLREVTIVDTPGTEAVVDEHREVTAEFLNLRNQLREQHNQDTERWASQADAVIYLISQVPRLTDKAFLEEFRDVTAGRSRALNAIGVVAKIDLYPEIRGRIPAIAEQLREYLNTVVPVSAGMKRALDRLTAENASGLQKIAAAISRIPQQRLFKLLDSDELWDEFDFEDCPVKAEHRRELRQGMPWSVFTTIVKTLSQENMNYERTIVHLQELTGFNLLRNVLERHFFRRAKLLRAFKTVNKARDILDQLRFKCLPQFEREDEENQDRLNRFLAFIRSSQGDKQIAQELENFLKTQLGASRVSQIEALLRDVGLSLSKTYHELEEYNADFEALTVLEQARDLFTETEYRELQFLFGLYGLDMETRVNGQCDPHYLNERQGFWSQQAIAARHETRRMIADSAARTYGRLLAEILG